MDNIVHIKNNTMPSVNKKEIMRYAGVGKLTQDMDTLILECLDEALGKLTYNVCYRKLPVRTDGKVVDFGFAKTESKHLSKTLSGYSEAVVFAASVGVEIDRLIKKYSLIEPSKSVIFQAIGAERAESLCDMFCHDIKSLYKDAGPRFSPGYGDFSLSFQRDIFRVLDCQKYIGVSLGDNLLMSPSKSVTAIMGISAKKEKV